MTASIRGGIFTMAMLLKGAEVAKALTEELHAKTEELKKNGVEPCLAILRVGAREDDLAYERGALKRCEKVGVAVRQVVLPEDVTQEVLMENIHALGADEELFGRGAHIGVVALVVGVDEVVVVVDDGELDGGGAHVDAQAQVRVAEVVGMGRAELGAVLLELEGTAGGLLGLDGRGGLIGHC